MPMHTADDSALHLEDQWAIAGPYRYSHRCARGELQRTALERAGRAFVCDSRPRARSSRPAVETLPHCRREILRQRTDGLAADSHLLRTFSGLRTIARTRDDATGIERSRP